MRVLESKLGNDSVRVIEMLLSRTTCAGVDNFGGARFPKSYGSNVLKPPRRFFQRVRFGFELFSVSSSGCCLTNEVHSESVFAPGITISSSLPRSVTSRQRDGGGDFPDAFHLQVHGGDVGVVWRVLILTLNTLIFLFLKNTWSVTAMLLYVKGTMRARAKGFFGEGSVDSDIDFSFLRGN